MERLALFKHRPELFQVGPPPVLQAFQSDHGFVSIHTNDRHAMMGLLPLLNPQPQTHFPSTQVPTTWLGRFHPLNGVLDEAAFAAGVTCARPA